MPGNSLQIQKNQKLEKAPLLFQEQEQLSKKEVAQDNFVLQEELLSSQQDQKEKILVLREMEQTNRKEILQASEIKWEGSTGKLQREGRNSRMDKARRKEIEENVKKADAESHNRIIGSEATKKDTLRDVIRGSYLLGLDKEVSERERMDVTGYERRRHASNHKKAKLIPSFKIERDLDNLIHNMTYDVLQEAKLDADPRMQFFYDASLFQKRLLERDKVLDKQFRAAKKREGNPDYWDPSVPETDESPAGLKRKYYMNDNLVVFMKFSAQNNMPEYEKNRAKLRAMQMAKKQLQEDQQANPSSYTEEMIKRLDKRIEEQHAEAEKMHGNIFNPANADNPDAVEASKVFIRQIYELAKLGEKLRANPDDPELEKQVNAEVERLITQFESPLKKDQQSEYEAMKAAKA